MQVVLTELAENDVDDIWLGVAQDNPGAADRLVNGLHGAIHRLAMFPGMGRAADHLRAGARAFVHGNYLIVYRSMDYGIAVLRIAHGARNTELIEFPPAPSQVNDEPVIVSGRAFIDATQRMAESHLPYSAGVPIA
jgi:toxin ParE1/3/4